MNASRFNVGDRVRVKGSDSLHVVLAATNSRFGSLLRVSDFDQQIAGDNFELVEVAHYAKPDVPMVAMTPDRIAALHTLDDAIMSHRWQSDEVYAAQHILMAMLAEAIGERAS